MKSFTINEILLASGGEFFGDSEVLSLEASCITTDSRKAGKGSVFAAIVGERVDGHSFIPQCVEMGTICSVCERAPADNSPHILVKNTPEALRKIAKAYREKFDIPFVGISGSVGKTSTKEIIASVLSEHFHTHKTQGNFNNALGVPITLFALEETHTAAVIEMGISDFGEMSILAEMSQPDIAVLTNVGKCHLENLKDLQGVLKAKTEMLNYLKKGGTVVLNGDDENLRKASLPEGSKVLYYGLSEENDVYATDIKSDNESYTDFTVHTKEGSFEARIHSLGNHMVQNALASVCVAKTLGLSEEEIVEGLKNYRTIGGRANIIKTEKLTLIDDCYNANPESMKASLKTLSNFEGRRVALLGDMKELGKKEKELHFEIGKLAAELKLDLLIAVGDLSLEMYKAARPYIDAEWYQSIEEARLYMYEMLTIGDTVLVKASHSMNFSELVEQIKEL
ncbi:MAG: UDP-N-acetylmuramoyl-tripeptide--D-alanyl-D-alanine ligase [Clostridia bacterium]|nr:UDP-N-acetylmuramoyl-tripeptide--D-alanyl-D-alanine ligase [Clostridia bacterium]